MTAKNSTNLAVCPDSATDTPTHAHVESTLRRVRVVLIGTTHAGNIGAAARAMKTMGLTKLMLVEPKAKLDAHAFSMASNALDVMDAIQRFDDLDGALAGCHWVIGASARLRDRPHELMSVRQMGEHARTAWLLNPHYPQAEIALVFGREHSGLTNVELGRCHAHMMIPANPVYSSLNLAQAVQIACYELRQALLSDTPILPQLESPQPAAHDAVENLLQHWETTLHTLEFLDPQNPRHMMQKLRFLLQRAQVTPNEVDILRGMLTAVQRKIRSTGQNHDV
ncbi:MAG TPA: RNA methyltransferase [bacterium]|nr:RNA methyltransferase [bacterium]